MWTWIWHSAWYSTFLWKQPRRWSMLPRKEVQTTWANFRMCIIPLSFQKVGTRCEMWICCICMCESKIIFWWICKCQCIYRFTLFMLYILCLPVWQHFSTLVTRVPLESVWRPWGIHNPQLYPAPCCSFFTPKPTLSLTPLPICHPHHFPVKNYSICLTLRQAVLQADGT